MVYTGRVTVFLTTTFSKILAQSKFSIPGDNIDEFFVGRVVGTSKGRKLKDNTSGTPGLSFMTTSSRVSSSAGRDRLDMLRVTEGVIIRNEPVIKDIDHYFIHL